MNVNTKAVRYGNSFGIWYIFGKIYRFLQNKKSEISGTFSTLVKSLTMSKYQES